MLWELVSGRRFWGDLSEVQILKKMAFGDVQQLSEAMPDVPAALNQICERAVAMVPADRYSTGLEFKAALDAFIAESDQRKEPSQVGAFVSELFEDRREEVKMLIQDRLANLKVSAPDAQPEGLPMIDMNADGTYPPEQGLRAMARSNPDGTASTRTVPSATEGPPSTSGIIATEMPSQVSVVRPPMSSVGRPLALVGLGIVVLVGLVVGLRMSSSSPIEATDTEASATPAASLVQVEIFARPKDATIYVDGAKVDQNPFSAKFPTDGTAHRIRVEAAGFETHEEMVTFASDVKRDIVLSKSPEPTAPSAAPSASSSAEPAASASAPPVGVRPGGAGWVRPPPPPPQGTGAQLEDDPWGNKKPR
jgi:hypothetical protein